MPSGPYQSNLLRFLVGQYHQGMNRHRQAVRKTRTQVELGVQVGAVVALSSVRKVIRASQGAGQKLMSSIVRLGLVPRKDAVTAKLIDFSEFDERVLAGKGETDCEVGEAAMAEVLVVTSNCLQPAQVSTLISYRSSFLQKVTGWRQSLSPLWKGLWKKRSDTESVSDNRFSGLSAVFTRSPPGGRITGLASDMKTRSLQLVIDYQQTWSGLSEQQQTEIQRKIWDCVGAICDVPDMFAMHNSRPKLNNVIAPVKSKSSQLMRQKPTDLVRTSSRQLVRAVNPTLLTFVHRFTAAVITSFSSPASLTLHMYDPPTLTPVGHGGSGASAYCDVDVISVDYIEHPSEKLLKWIDRIFLWIERLWQKFRTWQIPKH